jgi:plastocyanin
MRTLVLVFAALGLAACGSSSSTTSSGSTGGTTGTTGSSGTTGSQSITFTISSGKVWQSAVTVPVGGTLHVVNNDSAPHTVTSQASAGAFSPGAPAGITAFDQTVSAGATKDIVIQGGAAGTTIPFYCKFHTAMMSPGSPVITLQ